jgi:hypothetical protein
MRDSKALEVADVIFFKKTTGLNITISKGVRDNYTKQPMLLDSERQVSSLTT